MRLLSAFMLIFTPVLLISQDWTKEADKVYGPDPLLYNGRKYAYFPSSTIAGNQYLLSPEYVTGEVTILGKTFLGISLNYDIFNQQLLLQFTDEKGVVNIIELSKAWLESFGLGDDYFECHDYGEGLRFYQVLGNGSIRFLFFWRKEFKLDPGVGNSGFNFSLAKKTSYVLMNGEINAYRSKRHLLSLFPVDHGSEINDFLRQRHIRLKNASDREMTEIADFISTLYQ